MSNFKTVQDIDVAGKRLLIRVDFDVPLKDGQIVSDRRIVAALPTIQHALKRNARVVLMTHLGRSGDESGAAYSLRPVADRLNRLLDGPSITLVEDWADRWTNHQSSSEIVLLENLRFHIGEKECDDDFCDTLARCADVYVNDAFAACHHRYASTYGVAQRFDEDGRVIGLLVDRELSEIDNLTNSIQRPFVVLLGGATVSGKIGVIDRFLDRADEICVGGAIAYTFLKAAEKHVGASNVDEELVGFAKQLVTLAGDSMILPIDHVIAAEPHALAQIERADGGIPDDWHGVDIGPKTIEVFCDAIHEAGTVIWNGPMGKFEAEPFRHGTESIARAIAETDTRTLVGGGETGQAIEQFGVADAIDHFSTGDEAFLTYLTDGKLPALDVIPQRRAEHVS